MCKPIECIRCKKLCINVTLERDGVYIIGSELYPSDRKDCISLEHKRRVMAITGVPITDGVDGTELFLCHRP